MKKTRTMAALLVTLALSIAIFSSTAAQPPPIPSDYSGTVTIAGALAPDGTRVQAKIDTYASETVTTTGGKYSFLIVGPLSAAFEGKTVTFWVNGIRANETDTFVSGASKTLNLTVVVVAATPTPTPTPTPVRVNLPVIMKGVETER